jgi:hypothetical protein
MVHKYLGLVLSALLASCHQRNLIPVTAIGILSLLTSRTVRPLDPLATRNTAEAKEYPNPHREFITRTLSMRVETR